MRIADFRGFLRESANPFIFLCSKIDNSLKGKSIMTRVISDDAVEEKELKSTKTDASLYNGLPLTRVQCVIVVDLRSTRPHPQSQEWSVGRECP